jgi:N-acyl-L-homoserine lactone synthetase
MNIKIASEPAEFDQIHRINYKTFVQEIPQHKENEQAMLVDRFHDKNTYVIAKRDVQVIGMVCFNLSRPFSLDEKLPDLETYLPPFHKLAEIRLLAVLPEERMTIITYKLLHQLALTLMSLQVNAGVICGYQKQLHLYQHIGFIPFGPVVGSGEALYQPMYITLKELFNGFRSN